MILIPITIAVVLSLLILPTVSSNAAHADSIYDSYFQPSESECPKELDMICPIDLAKHPIYLTYNVSTNKAASKTYTTIELSVHENSTGETVPYPAYIITIYDNNSNASPILTDTFATSNTTLVLNLVHNASGSSNSNRILIDATDRDPFLNALLPSRNDTITITNVPIVASKAYLMKIELVRVADPHKGLVKPKAETNVSFSIDNDISGKVVIVPEFGSAAILAITLGMIAAVSIGSKRRAIMKFMK